MRQAKYCIEALGLRLLFALFRLLPLDMASWLGGALARGIGPLMPAHRVAIYNLKQAFPDMPPQRRNVILRGMWDNLGRTAAELPHLPGDLLFRRMQIHGETNLPAADQRVVFFSGHFGNWELSYPIAHRHGTKTALIYRKANNPYVDAMIASIRATQSASLFPKGPSGSVRLLRALKDGSSLAMLIDQKMNDGIPIPFFGRDAMTATAIAEFALRYYMPLIPARVVRKKGVHFEAFIYPPLPITPTGNHDDDIRTIMTQINTMLEGWIRDHPEQWFWVHRRWPRGQNTDNIQS